VKRLVAIAEISTQVHATRCIPQTVTLSDSQTNKQQPPWHLLKKLSFAEGTSKKVTEFGVFAWTAIASLWAYVWLLIVYELWTPNEITMAEAWLTFSYFPILVCVAYLLDARPWQKRNGDAANESTDAYQVGPSRMLNVLQPEHLAAGLLT
jgi:hypothetical protein